MKLLQFFQEDNGNLSATRLGFLLYTFGLTFMMGIQTYRGTPFAPSDNAVWILVALMTGKAVQKFGEQKPGG